MDRLTTTDGFSGAPAGTARRPLLGLTILLVEDSHFCSEAVRLMCLRGGARLRRADCLTAAYRHLATYRPSLVLVDLGLPDGSGIDIIRKLVALRPNAPVVLATSGDDPSQARPRAIKAGADGYLAKPVQSLRVFQDVVLGCFPDRQRVAAEQVVPLCPEIEPDQLAVVEDLWHLHGILKTAVSEGDSQGLRYCAQFLNSVAEAAGDSALKEAARDLFAANVESSETVIPILGRIEACAKAAREIVVI